MLGHLGKLHHVLVEQPIKLRVPCLATRNVARAYVSYWLKFSPCATAKCEMLKLCATFWTWSRAALGFRNSPLREQLRDVLENREVQGFILALLARAGLVSSPSIHLLLKAELCTVSAFACAPDLKRTTWETKSGFVKSTPFLSWAMGQTRHESDVPTLPHTPKRSVRCLSCASLLSIGRQPRPGGRPSQPVRDMRLTTLRTGAEDPLWHLGDAARSSSPVSAHPTMCT